MKNVVTVCVIFLTLSLGYRLWNPSPSIAQVSAAVNEGPQVVSTLSSCAWLTGANVTNGVAWCFVNTGVPSTSGMYFALNGSAVWTAQVPPASTATAGVTSLNGKTGVLNIAAVVN